MEDSHSAIVQADDYYPFGMTFNGYKRESSMMNRFLYNGKELQTDLDLGWMDYGARMYMPDLGRFTTIDPLAEKYNFQSSYVYAVNNPIRFEDTDGMEPGDRVKGPFTRENVRVNRNGRVQATRITTSARKSMNMSMGVVSTLPITRIAGTVVGIGYEVMKGSEGSGLEASLTAGGVETGKAFFDAASKNAVVGVNQGMMESAKKGVGNLGMGLGAFSIYKEATSEATSQEVLEGFTFSVGVKGNLGSLNIVNEGIFNFNNENITVGQAADVLNTIYNTLSGSLSDFDLSTKAGAKSANKYLRNNFGDIIKQINDQLRELYNKEDEK